MGLPASDVRASRKAARAQGLESHRCVEQMVASTAAFWTILAHFALHLKTRRARAVALAVLRDTIWAVLERREVSHTLETRDFEGLQETVCELMPSVGVLTCEHMNSLQAPDPQAMSVDTVVSLLVATQENTQPCGRVHMFAMGVLYTTAQTMNEITITEVMGDAGPNSDTRGQRQEKGS